MAHIAHVVTVAVAVEQDSKHLAPNHAQASAWTPSLTSAPLHSLLCTAAASFGSNSTRGVKTAGMHTGELTGATTRHHT